MNHHDDDLVELEPLDERARAAAAGLRRHVAQHLDSEGALPLPAASSGPRPPRAWRRAVAAVAAVALVIGGVSVLNQGDDARQRVDMDDIDALPDLEPGLLTPLGPRDGKDSIQLPVVVEPASGITDGQTVAVSGEGFLPGEAVGIVQCAREAGGETAETRGGAEGCNIGRFQQVTADEQGRAAGTFVVHRVLTTPLTGTVDCAAEANRCLVAMGAISDYDRSGGMAIELAGGGEPIEIPTVSVSPAEGLSDGDVVHVTVDGATPGDHLFIQVCSSDPQACWATGTSFKRDVQEGSERWTEEGLGLVTDWAGRAEGEMPVWRFLPGPNPGTYVDCAVSRCSLRISGSTAPPTVPLSFVGGGSGPSAPTLGVDPTDGLAPGDEVIVRGEGFAPGQEIRPMLCGGLADNAAFEAPNCNIGQISRTFDDGLITADESGAFAIAFEVPVLGGMCLDCDGSDDDIVEITCDGVMTKCWMTAESWGEVGNVAQRPVFAPTPVPVTFR